MTSAGDFRHFSEWTPEQKAEFFAFAGVSYVDYAQTTWAMKQRDANGNRLYYELNPILGKHPSKESVALLSVVAAGYYYYLIGSDSINPNYSIMGRTAMFSIKVAAVLHNDSIGISVSKAWQPKYITMMETLCLRNADKRYIVSVGKKILIVTHDYRYAERVEKEVVRKNITDENFCMIVGGRKK